MSHLTLRKFQVPDREITRGYTLKDSPLLNMNGRCCVFQPFDKGEFDRRYEDTIEPAIVAASLEPYRVDRDDNAVIPIDTLHEEIRSSSVCLADITTHNPNVLYEVGFAIASGKDVVLICSTIRPPEIRFPFDLQHRGIIQYSQQSARDFEMLKSNITSRLKASIAKQEKVRDIAAASPIISAHGLQAPEVAALAVIMANRTGSGRGVSSWVIKQDMESAGYTALATNLSLTRLERLGFLQSYLDNSENGDPFDAYRLLDSGEDWLLDHQDLLVMRTVAKTALHIELSNARLPLPDDEIPF